MSNAPSGAATPRYGLSRRSSHDNLQPLIGLSDPSNGQVNSALLQSRLANLQAHGPTPINSSLANHSASGGNSPYNGFQEQYQRPTPPQSASGIILPHRASPSSRPSYPHSASPSRRGSIDHAQSPNEVHQDDYNLGNLSRVPSYGAALRTSEPHTPYAEGPPSYDEATSRPPSPHGPQRPTQAHVRVRSGQASPTHINNSTSTLHPSLGGFGGMSLGSIPDGPEVGDSRPGTSDANVGQVSTRINRTGGG